MRSARYGGVVKTKSGAVQKVGPHAVAILPMTHFIPEPQRTSALQSAIINSVVDRCQVGLISTDDRVENDRAWSTM